VYTCIYRHTNVYIIYIYKYSYLLSFTVRKEQVCLQVFQVNDMKHLSYTITVKLNFGLHFNYKLEERYINSVLRIRLKKALFIKLLLW